jgi:tripartite-type tricarboxylate transporter receptor subunit TctC
MRPLCRLVSALAALALCGHAMAQQAAWPNRPVRILVPFTTGGSADALARLMGEKLSVSWGQQVLVENRGGAGGTIGMVAAQRLPADGHNFVLISNSHASSHVLYPKLTYDLTKDFAPVSITVNSPMVIVSSQKLALTGIADLVARAKRDPGKLSYGSCGVGTTHHLAMEILKYQADVSVAHIPYRGCSLATADLMGGQLDLAIVTLSSVNSLMRQGKLRAVAVPDKRRALSAPEVPTVAEGGVAALRNFDVGLWLGFMAPLGTPAEFLTRFDAESRKAIMLPDMQPKLDAAGLEPRFGDGKELMEVIEADIRQFRQIVDYAKITVQ